VNTNPGDPDLPYTLGAHNSFITLAVRSGIIGLLLFLIFFSRLIRQSIRYFQFSYVKGALAMFLFLNVAALFNVIMESPLYSGVYWILAGLLFGVTRTARISSYYQLNNSSLNPPDSGYANML